MEYYQRTYNTELLATGKFSAKEDDVLRKVVAECGDKDWVQVALRVQSMGCLRSEQQCLHR